MKNRWSIFVLLLLILCVLLASMSYFKRDNSESMHLINPFDGIKGESLDLKNAVKQVFKNVRYDIDSILNYYLLKGNDLKFEEISFVTADEEENIYFIDKSRKRVVKMRRNNTVDFTMESDRVLDLLKSSGNQYGSSIVNAQKIAASAAYECYFVLYSVKDQDGKISEEIIIQYPLHSTKGDIFHRNKYPEPLEIEKIEQIFLEEDSLYMTVKENNGKAVSQYKLGTVFKDDEKMVERCAAFKIPDGKHIKEVAGSVDGSFYFTTMEGELFRAVEGGKINQVGLKKEGTSGEGNHGEDIFPWHMASNRKSTLYFVDIFGQRIYRETKKESENIFWKAEIPYRDAISGFEIVKINNISLCKESKILCSAIANIKDGKETSKKQSLQSGIMVIDLLNPDKPAWIYEARYSKKEMAARWFILINYLVLVLFGLFILYYIYDDLMQRKIKLLFKQVIIYIPILITALFFVSWITGKSVSNEDIDQKHRTLSHIIADVMVDNSSFKGILTPKDFEKSLSVNAKLQSLIKSNNGKEADQGTYVVLYKKFHGKLYPVVDTGDVKNYFNPPENSKELEEEYLKVLDTGKQISGISKDSEGNWRYALAQIKDSHDKALGICEVGIDMKAYAKKLSNIDIQNRRIILLVFFVIIVVFFITSYLLQRSLRILNRSVGQVAMGNWGLDISVKGSDEVAELGQSVKIMAQKIEKYIKNIKDINKAYLRFVPVQYLHYLKKDSITEIRLGDQVEKDISMVVIRVRSFAALSGKMSPKANFEFVNGVIKYLCPAIREQHGFVDEYSGYGIMALFPKKAIHAVMAAVKVREYLGDYNAFSHEQGKDVIELGIAVHTGPLMLGIIGDGERLEGTVISDNVSLVTAIEKLSGCLGASILVSGDTLSEDTLSFLDEHGMRCRYIGRFKLEEKTDSIELFDLFEGDERVLKSYKQATKAEFEQGVQYYQCGRFYDARDCFVNVIKENREDKAAKVYFLLSDEYYRSGSPKGWDGSIIGRDLT
ncbi:MAG: adenylate/guanylate cyclase domain-containing protein [Clostridia bacterium]|nr:adenylate/guanylate cyclase domain-containing protein [Clostridia bacterium]